MELAGLRESLDRNARTFLKDNLSWHLFFPSANTTPWQLEGAILALKESGFSDLLVYHNKTVVNDPVRGGRLNRLDVVYQNYNIPEKFNYLPECRWAPFRPRRSVPALDKIYPDGIYIPQDFIGANIVHLPTVKCHVYTTTTGAMKNAFGGLLNTRRHYSHSVIHRTLVDLLIVQQEIHTGIFALMDGVFAGNGPGPRTMQPVEKNVILASADQVAIDAVAAKLMGFDPLSIGYIKMAHDEGLGVGDPREIQLVGDDVNRENWGFQVGDNLASITGDLLWFGPLKTLQRLFFHTPLVNMFTLASYLFHDYLWYPIQGRRGLREFKNSKWGRFREERYPASEMNTSDKSTDRK
jgi:hypothetical protein